MIGETNNELGGSEYFSLIFNKEGNVVPRVNLETLSNKMEALLKANDQKLILSCHDCSEGGLSVALSEMLMAGGFGAELSLNELAGNAERVDYKLFSESNGRWIVEVSP